MSKQHWGDAAPAGRGGRGLCLAQASGGAISYFHFPGRVLLSKSACWDPLLGFLPGSHAAPGQEKGAFAGTPLWEALATLPPLYSLLFMW